MLERKRVRLSKIGVEDNKEQGGDVGSGGRKKEAVKGGKEREGERKR